MNHEKDPETGHFLEGNRFWLRRTRHGRKSLMESAEKLQEACLEYFNDVTDNPLYEDKIGWYEGSASHEDVRKMQVMSIQGLVGHLGISRPTWYEWRKRPDLSTVVAWAENVIETQQIAGATAGLMNASIISRLLSLTDKKEVAHKSTDESMSLSSCPSFQKAMDEMDRMNNE